MTGGLVLVDTSVWVEFFNRPTSAHHARVADLLDADRVAISGVIAAELIRGCRQAREREEVEAALGGLVTIEVDFTAWLAIGREMFSLLRRGITVSMSDAAIAFAARSAGAALYTLDPDFRSFPGVRRLS